VHWFKGLEVAFRRSTVIRRNELKSKPGLLSDTLLILRSDASIMAVLLLALLLASVGSVKAQSRRVEELVTQLSFTSVTPRPSNWSITVPSQADWDKQVRTLNLQTATAFTFMNETNNSTFLNPDYVFNSKELQLLHTIAHEAGHLICRCTDERVANDIARGLEGR
jgi:hypothetical protein